MGQSTPHPRTRLVRLQLPPAGTVSSALTSMFRSIQPPRLITLITAAALCGGCFTDQGSGNGDDGTTSGPSGSDGSESTAQISASFTNASSVTITTSGPTSTSADDTATTSSSSTTEDPDTTATSTTDPTDTGTSSSSSSSTGDEVLNVADLEPGDLVITEVMANPNCTGDNCEWFELYNATAFPIDLQLLGIGDDNDFDLGMPGAVLSVNAILEPGALGIIARQDLWPYEGVDDPLATYPNTVQLSNNSFESVAIFGADDMVLDHTATFLPNAQPGRSRILRPEFWDGDNEDSDNWCWSDTVLLSNSTADDWGTPGTELVECL